MITYDATSNYKVIINLLMHNLKHNIFQMLQLLYQFLMTQLMLNFYDDFLNC